MVARGQQSIDTVVFFKLILVGYLENLCCDRKVIEYSKLRLDILFFLGYDLDEELPNSLFYIQHPGSIIEPFFLKRWKNTGYLQG